MFVVIVSLLANIYQFSHLRYLSPKDGTNCLDVKLEQIRLGFNHKKALILLRYCSKLCYYDNLLYNNKKKNKKKLNYINNIYVYIYIYIYKQLDTFLYKLKRRRVYTLSSADTSANTKMCSRNLWII